MSNLISLTSFANKDNPDLEVSLVLAICGEDVPTEQHCKIIVGAYKIKSILNSVEKNDNSPIVLRKSPLLVGKYDTLSQSLVALAIRNGIEKTDPAAVAETEWQEPMIFPLPLDVLYVTSWLISETQTNQGLVRDLPLYGKPSTAAAAGGGISALTAAIARARATAPTPKSPLALNGEEASA